MSIFSLPTWFPFFTFLSQFCISFSWQKPGRKEIWWWYTKIDMRNVMPSRLMLPLLILPLFKPFRMSCCGVLLRDKKVYFLPKHQFFPCYNIFSRYINILCRYFLLLFLPSNFIITFHSSNQWILLQQSLKLLLSPVLEGESVCAHYYYRQSCKVYTYPFSRTIQQFFRGAMRP